MCDASFVCAACGGLVREARREVHETLWCPSIEVGIAPSSSALASTASDKDDAEDSGRSEEDFERLPLELLRLTSSQYDSVLTVEFSFAPGCPLSLEQRIPSQSRGRKPEHETGGQMWWSELVLAEYLVESGRRGQGHSSDCRCVDDCGGRHEKSLRALALGCGAAPVSGFAAAALGWDVLLTDLEEVLPLTRHNLAANAPSVAAVHSTIAREGYPLGRMTTAALVFGQPLTMAVQDWAADGTISLVLCSDLIWEAHRHRPLAATLAELLSPPLAAPDRSEVLIAYQCRQLDELEFFSVLPDYGLRHERLDVSGIVRRTKFSYQLLEQVRRAGTDPADWFFVHRVWRIAETCPVYVNGRSDRAPTE